MAKRRYLKRSFSAKIVYRELANWEAVLIKYRAIFDNEIAIQNNALKWQAAQIDWLNPKHLVLGSPWPISLHNTIDLDPFSGSGMLSLPGSGKTGTVSVKTKDPLSTLTSLWPLPPKPTAPDNDHIKGFSPSLYNKPSADQSECHNRIHAACCHTAPVPSMSITVEELTPGEASVIDNPTLDSVEKRRQKHFLISYILDKIIRYIEKRIKALTKKCLASVRRDLRRLYTTILRFHFRAMQDKEDHQILFSLAKTIFLNGFFKHFYVKQQRAHCPITAYT